MNEVQKHNSFQTLYADHNDALFRFCLTKVRDRHVAIDLVQESFIRLWDYIEKQDDLTYPKALLYRIAHNLVVDWARKKKAQSLDTILDAGLELASNEDLGPDHVSRDDMRSVLRTMEKLPASYREVVMMRYVDGLSVTEIADLSGEQANTISVRLHRAMEKLRIELGDNPLSTA